MRRRVLRARPKASPLVCLRTASSGTSAEQRWSSSYRRMPSRRTETTSRSGGSSSPRGARPVCRDERERRAARPLEELIARRRLPAGLRSRRPGSGRIRASEASRDGTGCVSERQRPRHLRRREALEESRQLEDGEIAREARGPALSSALGASKAASVARSRLRELGPRMALDDFLERASAPEAAASRKARR